MKKQQRFELTSFVLHLLAMGLMLLDHMWATVVPENAWMTTIGRMAFPIFAFMIVEGYFHTHDLKKYVGRMLIFAVISEIPFNLMMGQTVFYPMHQNVLWTFLIGIWMIYLNEKARKTGKVWLRVLVGVGTVLASTVLGLVTMVDYNHYGVYTVLVFYFFRGSRWWQRLGQLLCLGYINTALIAGIGTSFHLFGMELFVPQQAFAVLALIPIWLYHGKQGPHPKWFQYTCYAFYPVHILVLVLLRSWIWLMHG